MKPSPSGLSLTAKSGKNRPGHHAEHQRDDHLTEEGFGETGHGDLRRVWLHASVRHLLAYKQCRQEIWKCSVGNPRQVKRGRLQSVCVRRVVRRRVGRYDVAHANTPTSHGGGQIPVLGLGTWRMGETAGRLPAEVAAVRAGHRDGLPPDRHRRDVRRGRRRGGGGPGDRRGAARRRREARGALRRQQGLSAQRQPQGHAGRLRAQPGAAGAGPHRPLPAALARRASAGRNLRGDARAGRARAHPALGREQLRHRRHGGTGRRLRRAAGLRGEPGLLLGERARAGVQPAAVAARSAACP